MALWQLFGQAVIDLIEAEQAVDFAGANAELPSPLRVIAFRSVNDLTDTIKRLRRADDMDIDCHTIAYELRHEALRQLVNGGGNGRE